MGETVLGNRYEIIRKIGDGGMAFVYEAKDRLLNRTVAVKVLRPEFVDDEEFLGKFKREAEAVASLSHQNIVNVYDVGEDGKVHYIVMEFVDGQNLKEIIKNEGTLDEYTALDITKQIAMALSAAHKKGIIHRDIKPHNILISNEERVVKVADFGIAKAVSNSTVTNIGSIIGSVHYFSPEQAKGKFVSNNADLYSLGIVLYEMLLGKVPFRGDSPISIALQHINDDIEFTQEEKVNIPQSVRTIIKKLTEKSSDDRYQSAEELIEDIEYIEKNIDLDFIKEYDNFATQKIEQKDLGKATKQVVSPVGIEDDYDEDEYDEDEYEDEEEIIRPRKEKKATKINKKTNKDPKKSRKRLKIAAVILGLILVVQVFLMAKFVFSGALGNKIAEDGTLTIPDVQSMSLEEARRELDKFDLKVSWRGEHSGEVEKGGVISQTPLPGSDAKKGDIVNLVISEGSKSAEVPYLVGFTQAEAENIIKDNKLRVGRITEEHSDRYIKGVVLRQSHPEGTSIEEGDKIDLVISKGPEVLAPEPTPEPEKPIEPSKPDTGGNNGSGTTNPGGGNNGSNNNGSGTTNPGEGNGGSDNNGSGTTNPGEGNSGSGGTTNPDGNNNSDSGDSGSGDNTENGTNPNTAER